MKKQTINLQAEKVKLELDAAIAAVRASERVHGDECSLMEIMGASHDGEAELYRNLRSLETRYAQLLDAENDEHQEGLSEWAG